MENVIYNLASGRHSASLKISVACLLELGHLSDKLREVGVESSLVPRMIPGFSIVYPRRLIRFIQESGCDIVHTHSGCWSKVAAACARIPGMKLIYTEHGRGFPDSKQQIFLDRIAMRSTDKVVAVGDSLKGYLIRTVKLPEGKVVTIRNGVDTERFKPSTEREEVRRELGYSHNNVVIGIVARLAPVKNHRLLINAFRIVAGKCPEARLLIVGDGALRADLESMVSQFLLNEKVTFVGDRSDVPRLLTGIDISTLSSRSEGTSLTLLEAMSSGLPVVATAVGGNPAIIEDRVNGFLTDLDEETYAERLDTLIQSPELRIRMGEKARQTVIDDWSAKKMIIAYQELYQGLIGGR